VDPKKKKEKRLSKKELERIEMVWQNITCNKGQK